MPRETRKNTIFTDDPLLTSEDIDLHVKTYQQLKILDQKLEDLRTSGKSFFDSSILRTSIDLIFNAIRNKNEENSKLQDDKKHIDTLIVELSEENDQLKKFVKERDDRIKKLLDENQEILDADYQLIVDKNTEIEVLKTQLNNSKSLYQELKENENANITLSQDFFVKTPVKKNKPTPLQSTTKTNGREIFFTPQKTPNIRGTKPKPTEEKNQTSPKTKSPKPKTDNADNYIDNRLTNIEQNLGKILDRIQDIEKSNNNLPRQIFEPIAQQNETLKKKETKKSEKINIYITGDHHAQSLKTAITKQVPTYWKLEEDFKSENNFAKIAAQSSVDCTNAIIVVGSNDIQKTPMKEIKQSINTIFEKFKNSTIHFVQIPYRYDDTNLNYHIEQVNNIIFNYIMRFKNVIVYKPSELTKNWDYADKVNLNRNGKTKICQAINRTILGSKQDQPNRSMYKKPTYYQQPQPTTTSTPRSNPESRQYWGPRRNFSSHPRFPGNNNQSAPRFQGHGKYTRNTVHTSQQNIRRSFNPNHARSSEYMNYHFPSLPTHNQRNSLITTNLQNSRTTQHFNTSRRDFP
uniref:Uncharacterized protein n=1 Tax=Cacopsylla melanoneura TaxID=428564 RepID=A0A8D8MGN1_9HEMI